jgi:Spy/CpxP family protein refolding chaperone
MRRRVLPLALLLLSGLQARAGGAPDPRQQDPIRDRLFPPELIMQHQAELGIDDRQREALTKELAAFQSRIVDLQWKLSSAAEDLARLLDAPRIDEARALAQADKVMALEHDVKKSHLGLLIRLRNLLTDSQRAQLGKLRKDAP